MKVFVWIMEVPSAKTSFEVVIVTIIVAVATGFNITKSLSQ